jgi:23S rRNA (uracil1939-C5)-methyltransferase
MIKNDSVTIEITDVTHEGQGVGRYEGLTVFVDGALIDEEVLVRIIKVNSNYSVGKVIKIIRESPHRIQPFCLVFQKCGGCNIQQLEYSEQLKLKRRLVEQALIRIGKISGATINDTIGMEKPFHYRNKAQYPVSFKNGQTLSGFYAKQSHEVIDCGNCSIQTEQSNSIKDCVLDFLRQKKINIYNEVSHKGLVRHIMTRSGFHTDETMVVLVINGSSLPFVEELVERLTYGFHEIHSIVLNINMKRTNVIMGDKNITVFGEDYITDKIGEFIFKISPNSFFQVNPVQTQVLYQTALDFAGLTGCETVYDLYCGAGTISLFLSQKAKKVIGVEIVKQAVHDAQENAFFNDVHNVEFICGEAEEVIPRLYNKGEMADVVVVDPPRKGCDQKLLETLVEMAPSRIVYVSCNPATLARDLGYLSQNGFEVREVQPVDMFPWTGHVECVVRIQKR